MALMVHNVAWPGDDGDDQAAVALHLSVDRGRVVAARLVKKSLDARHRPQTWRAVYRVEVLDEDRLLAKNPPSTRRWNARDEGRYGLDDGAPAAVDWAGRSRPIIVGAGPAGLFAALYLAEAGAPVILFERGGPIEDRVPAVNHFWRRKVDLDPENNLVFGEGGAGTFSDGKIYTRRRDGELGFIFRRLGDFGAPESVLSDAYAHLGTDRIRAILPPFRERLRELGTEIRFHTRVDRLLVENGVCVGVVLADGDEVRGGPVVVATGHSARDAAQMMLDAGAKAQQRSIAVGVRIEHSQVLVDAARYGSAERGDLPPASYRMAFNPAGERKVHTFCMCPGGVVVPASNHSGRVVVNGMSFSARRAKWANSALIVEVNPSDYGADDPMAGFRWQDEIEARSFAISGDYTAPAQRVSDLFAGVASTDLPRSSFPMGIAPTDLREILPGFAIEAIKRSITAFDAKLTGFGGQEGILIAPETRTTSPIRFLRDDRQCSISVRDLYPTGEGSGYGGGIISCALDGLRTARAIVLSGS
jgi:uncharacterized FAD-dependent dehydrogenase